MNFDGSPTEDFFALDHFIDQALAWPLSEDVFAQENDMTVMLSGCEYPAKNQFSYFLDLYYINFLATHFFSSSRRHTHNLIRFHKNLQLVINCVVSHADAFAPTNMYKGTATDILNNHYPEDGPQGQALLFLAISLHIDDEQRPARSAIDLLRD